MEKAEVGRSRSGGSGVGPFRPVQILHAPGEEEGHVEHLQEAGIGSYEVQGIILFIVLHSCIGAEFQWSTSYDLVVRYKGGVTIL